MHVYYFFNNEEYMHISVESWFKIHLMAINSLDFPNKNNITYYSFFEFNYQKNTICTNWDLLNESRNWVINRNQLFFNKQVCLHLKNNYDRLYFLDSKIRDELFYSSNLYGYHFYYILNDLQETYPIYNKANMNFYFEWYNSRYRGVVYNLSKKDIDLNFPGINMNLYRTNLEYVDYCKLWMEEKLILEKISNLKMDIIY